MRTDFFNEAMLLSMLVALAGEETEKTGEPMRAEDLRERLIALMDRAGHAARLAGLSDELAETADFAVCAFMDETLMSSVSWPGRADWLKKPLQFARHGTATAGEDFFRLLDDLLKAAEKNAAAAWEEAEEPAEDAASERLRCAVLEIFALCLAQGFTGMFYGDPAAIRDRLERIGRFVPALGLRAEALFQAPAEMAKEPRPLRQAAMSLRRFDPLDLALWLIPLALTALFRLACETRLDRLLQAFLQGGA